MQTPESLGNVSVLFNFLGGVLPIEEAHVALSTEITLQLLSAAAAFGGIFLAYLIYIRYAGVTNAWAINYWATAMYRFWLSGWGFDWLYYGVIVRPISWIARVNRGDFIDGFYRRHRLAEQGPQPVPQRHRERTAALVCHGNRRRGSGRHRDWGVPMILAWIIAIPLIGGLLPG